LNPGKGGSSPSGASHPVYADTSASKGVFARKLLVARVDSVDQIGEAAQRVRSLGLGELGVIGGTELAISDQIPASRPSCAHGGRAQSQQRGRGWPIGGRVAINRSITPIAAR
jgi:hypothetical protein